MLKCEHCDKVYKYESERKRHQESHFPQFECTVCSKKFSFLSALRRHQKQHERKGSIQCNECGRNFRDEILLKRHGQYAHTGTYNCLQCSSTFNSEQALRTHSKIHKPESERRFRCKFQGCKKTFNFPHHLKHHELTHTNAKQHFCNVCGKGFIQSHHLKTHLKIHHSENWLFCAVPGCKTIFTTKYALRKHMLTHNQCIDDIPTEIKLDSGISSDSNSANDIHEKRHTGDNVLCATCGNLILRHQLLNHKLNCTPASEEHFKSNNLEDTLLNYGCNVDLQHSSNSTYHGAEGTYAINVRAEVNNKSTGSFTDTYHCDTTDNKNSAATEIKGIFGTSTNNVNVKTCAGCSCSDGQRSPGSKSQDNALSLESTASYTCKNNNMPEIEYRKDGIVKIRETFDVDITIMKEAPEEIKSKVKNESNDSKHVPFNSCKAVLGNCIVSEDGSVGEGCLCAKMIVDEQQMSAQEIDELTPNPNALWV